MKVRLFLLTLCLLVFIKQESIGQAYYEIGVYAGPVALFSDYGERYDFDTNIGNIGFGIGASHYFDFSYGRNKYFNQHFMVRNEVAFHRTTLKHYGRWVRPEKTSRMADQLRAMKGSTSVFEFGSHLEFFPMDILEFNRGRNKLMPFFTAGFNGALFFPKASSDLGKLNSVEATPTKYMYSFKNDPGFALAFVGGFGVRYKISQMSDLVLYSRWTIYFSDWVDGLNPDIEHNRELDVPENKYYDWLYWLSVGYVFYLD
jgi:hypothetical protein